MDCLYNDQLPLEMWEGFADDGGLLDSLGSLFGWSFDHKKRKEKGDLTVCYIQSLCYSFNHSIIHSLVYCLIHCFIHSFTASFIHCFIHSMRSPRGRSPLLQSLVFLGIDRPMHLRQRLRDDRSHHRNALLLTILQRELHRIH